LVDDFTEHIADTLPSTQSFQGKSGLTSISGDLGDPAEAARLFSILHQEMLQQPDGLPGLPPSNRAALLETLSAARSAFRRGSGAPDKVTEAWDAWRAAVIVPFNAVEAMLEQ
jgi:hypothetical protein